MNIKKLYKFYCYFLFFLLSFSFLLFSTSILFAQEDIEKIINSKPEGYVTDYANILDLNDNNEISELAKVIDQKSKVQIAVVTIPSLGLYTIEEFSYKIFEKWGVGQKGENNGILIALALNEKKVKIEVGYGLEYLIPDSKAALIIQNFGIPYFKQSYYGKGIYNMVYKLGSIVAENNGQKLSDWLNESGVKANTDNEGSGFFIFILFIILFFIFSTIFRRPRYVGYRNRSVGNQLFNAYLASSIMKNTFFGNNVGSFKNSGFGGFKGGGFGGFGGFGGGSSGGGGATGGW